MNLNTNNLDTEVLIVGAGPTGLVMALELYRYGIKCRIIDKKPQATQTSNAGGIHTRVLELLDKEISQELVKHGRMSNRLDIFRSKKKILDIDFNFVDTPFPYILLIPQKDTEAILLQALAQRGIHVEWNKTLQNINQAEKIVTAEIKTENNIETIRAKWLVGCDGYRSTLRDLLDIPYRGEDFLLQFIMIDTQIHMEKPLEFISAFIGKINLLAVPFLNTTRLIAEISYADPEFKSKSLPDEKIFTKICEEHFSGKFTIDKPIWASHFFIHQRLADHYHDRRIFLVGDAAHTHSPAGGHGMNTGIQDSINLAWKLAMVIKNQASEKLLESYELERRPVAKEILMSTNLETRMVMSKNKIFCSLRNCLLPLINRISFIKKKVANNEAEVLVNYQKSPIVLKSHRNGILRSGSRIPNLFLSQNKNIKLFEYLTRKSHVILDFSYNLNGDELKNLDQNILQKIEVIKIDKVKNNIRKLFGCENGYCLVRPDNYIAYIGKNSTAIEDYFSKL